jgi:thiol-disulfide isomerase/thioredoxin
MAKKLLVGGLLVLAAAAGFLLRQAIDQDNPTPPVSTAAPASTQATTGNTGSAPAAADPAITKVAFALADLKGTTRNFSEWDGKSRIVNFWATWCAPCRREIPLLKRMQDEFAADGVQVLGIAVDFTEDVIAYAREASFNYPILVGQEDAMAVAETSGVEFIGLPFTMIVTPGGELLSVHLGEIHEPELRAIIGQLASLQRGEVSFAEAQRALKSL